MYDASQGGQLGAVVNATTPGEGEPFAEFTAKVGDYGQSELVLKAGGSNEDNTFSYFVGARRSTSDLYIEAPDPNRQDLNNDGSFSPFWCDQRQRRAQSLWADFVSPGFRLRRPSDTTELRGYRSTSEPGREQ